MRILIIVLFLSFISLSSSSKTYVKALTEQMGQEVIELTGNLKELPPDIDEEPAAESEEESKVSSQKVKGLTPATTKKDAKKTTQNAVKTSVESRKRDSKDIDKLESISQGVSVEDAAEEDKIEKEFADLYKDNADYKSDSSELKEKGTNSTKKTTNNDYTSRTIAGRDQTTDKPILRERTNSPVEVQPESAPFDPAPLNAPPLDSTPLDESLEETQVRLHYDIVSCFSFKFQPDSYDYKDVERFRTSIDEISCGNRVTKLTQEVKSSATKALPRNAATLCNVAMLLTIISSISYNM